VQVTVEYKLDKGACIPLRVHTIVISAQHSSDIKVEELRRSLLEDVIKVCMCVCVNVCACVHVCA